MTAAALGTKPVVVVFEVRVSREIFLRKEAALYCVHNA
jgi:hypothetical protein